MIGDVRIEGERKFSLYLENINKRVWDAAKKVTTKHSMSLANYIKREHLTGGTTATKLAVRTGHLRAKTTAKKTRVTGDGVEGGVDFGAKYAGVHIGPRGQKTVIRPKKGKFLVFPIRAGAAGRPIGWVCARQVTIPARVHPEDIGRARLPLIMNDLHRELERL